jgi:hypothetical protein
MLSQPSPLLDEGGQPLLRDHAIRHRSSKSSGLADMTSVFFPSIRPAVRNALSEIVSDGLRIEQCSGQ